MKLPNARLVSNTVHPDMDKPDIVHTLMQMLFGQFVDHDMSRTAVSKLATSANGRFTRVLCSARIVQKQLGKGVEHRRRSNRGTRAICGVVRGPYPPRSLCGRGSARPPKF